MRGVRNEAATASGRLLRVLFPRLNAVSAGPGKGLSGGFQHGTATAHSFGTPVSLSGGDSLNSRLGLSLDHQQSWRDANGKFARMRIYGIANAYYEFLDGPEADVAGTMFASDEARLQGSLGLGGA
jgi:outer membrane autotransporter protein